MKNKNNTYINPYLGGFFLGLVLLASFFFTGRGLGASGAAKTTVVAAVNTISSQHAKESEYYSQFISDDKNTMNTWLSFEVLGVFAGAFLSGALAGRLKFRTEYGPRITSKRRLLFALLGGVLFGFGSQLGRGCTSGAALSGMATLATAGFVTMLSIFGTGFLVAYFFRKNWI